MLAPLFSLSPNPASVPTCPPLLSYLASFFSSPLSSSVFFDCNVDVPSLPSLGPLRLPLILVLALSFGLSVFAFELYLDSRQRSCYLVKEVPPRLAAAIRTVESSRKDSTSSPAPPLPAATDAPTSAAATLAAAAGPAPSLSLAVASKFAKAQSYGYDKITYSMVHSSYSTLESTVFTILGYMPFFWHVSDRAYEMSKAAVEANTRTPAFVRGLIPARGSGNEEIAISVVFFVLTALVAEITNLPWEMYHTFVIERKHNFNKMTLGLYFTDKVKTFALTAFLGSPVVALVLVFLKYTGPNFFIYTWALCFVLSLGFMTIYPSYIAPLFNKYEPLPDGPLRRAIFALAQRLDYPLTKLFVVDGSKRSSHSNAYLFGFGKNKRIVLYDTLLTQVDEGEVLAILGHELGHWSLWHTAQNFAVVQLYLAGAFLSFSLATGSGVVSGAFGFDAGAAPTLVSLLLFFTTLWAPVDKALSVALTLNSRSCEFAADKHSADLGMGQQLCRGLCKIHLENLGAMCPDWAYSAYHYSHPPLVERLKAIQDGEKERGEEDKKRKKDN